MLLDAAGFKTVTLPFPSLLDGLTDSFRSLQAPPIDISKQINCNFNHSHQRNLIASSPSNYFETALSGVESPLVAPSSISIDSIFAEFSTRFNQSSNLINDVNTPKPMVTALMRICHGATPLQRNINRYPAPIWQRLINFMQL